MIADENNTCDKFFTGINDTGEQLLPVFSQVSLIPVRNFQKAYNLSPVSTTPLKNCSAMSTTPPIRQC
jgi:hypothetical protein